MKRKSFQQRLDRWMGPAFQRPPDPTIAPEGADLRERRARRALRWYAPSWREAHGEELLATVLDTAPARVDVQISDLPLSTRLDVALGGLRQRRRARPSFIDRSRLYRGNGSFKWEGLAWTRDALDQRGYALRWGAYSVVMGAVYAAIVSADVGRSHGFAYVLPVFSMAWLLLSAFFLLPIRLFAALKRTRAIERAGLNVVGWPLSWSQAPAPSTLITPVCSAPPAVRWVIGELRVALATCMLGGTVAAGAAYLLFLGNTEPAKPFGRSIAPHISDLAWLVFVVSGACLIIGLACTRGSVRRARAVLSPVGRPRSLESLPLTSPSDLPHHLSRLAWPAAAFLAVAPAVPLYGWFLGGIEIVAIPLLIAMLAMVRRTEQETGVAVHQRQVAAAIGGRFWSDQWMPEDATCGTSLI